jgi:hypothetical protein
VTDGTLLLRLQPAEEGGYVVTSPFDPDDHRGHAEALRESRLKIV